MKVLIANVIVISTPTIEKKLIPKSSGAIESKVVIADITKIGILICFFVRSDITIIAIKTQVRMATINGEKLA